MPSDSPSPDKLPLNLPEQDAILFGVTGSGKVAYYDTTQNRLLIGTYSQEKDVLTADLTFDVGSLAAGIEQFSSLPTDIDSSIIFEVLRDADYDSEYPYITALLDAGFTSEDVSTILPVREEQVNAVVQSIDGDEQTEE